MRSLVQLAVALQGGPLALKVLRQRIDEGLASAKDSAEQVLQQTRHAAACADQYAKDEPWRIAGAALAVGALVTYVMCRR